MTVIRVPQEERSRLMRARLLDATVELLVERGFAGTTTTLVSERAGVSRGAQLHHFPSKNSLVLAAVEHVMAARDEAIERLAAKPGDIRAALRALADYMDSPAFLAALELWVAARTDPELLALVAPFEQRLGRDTHRAAVRLLGADESRPGVRELVQGTLDMIRGLGLAATLGDDTRRRRRILDRWAVVLEENLGHPTRSSASPASLLRRRSDGDPGAG